MSYTASHLDQTSQPIGRHDVAAVVTESVTRVHLSYMPGVECVIASREEDNHESAIYFPLKSIHLLLEEIGFHNRNSKAQERLIE